VSVPLVKGLAEKLAEPVEIVDAALEVKKRSKLSHNQVSVQCSQLALDDPSDIDPVLVATGEDLVHNQVLSAAGTQRSLVDLPGRCALHGSFLKVKGTQGDVDRNTVVGNQKSDAMLPGELTRVVEPRGKPTEKPIDDRLLVTKLSQDSKVDVASQPWLPPAEYRKAAYEAESPTVPTAKVLDLDGGGEKRVHARARAKIRCCSTSPDP
jgi:hypothetical protein